ncbi:Auxin-induced protein 15A [Nymphaea thermarum]|nr:Auxin-induced protein 15A [Nymphaea thermarum]
MEINTEPDGNPQIGHSRPKQEPNAVNLRQEEEDVAACSIPPTVSRRIWKASLPLCDSDEEGCSSPDPPPDVPKGHLAVYVGPELRRFVVPTSYLTLPVFRVLLEKMEKEFGFDHMGALTIPCDVETFKYLLQWMHNSQKEQNGTGN